MSVLLETATLQEPALRVLEIGCGPYIWGLAKNAGGLIFQAENVQYVGIDLPERLEEATYGPTSARIDPGVIAADCAHLPFGDNVFDLVLMRSVLGQFTDTYTRLNFDSVREFGLQEAWRTLKGGGDIVIAEENTPWYPDYTEEYLQSAGFDRITAVSMQERDYEEVDFETSAWGKLRARYYGDSLLRNGSIAPYIMTATKPPVADRESIHSA